ncbi:hypothetical protein FO519_009768, partial [Halicephalobus sp. NKZ332]
MMNMRRMLTQGRIPQEYENSVTMKKVMKAYNVCEAGHDARPALHKLVQSLEEKFLQGNSTKSISEATAWFQREFGYETFFNFEVLPNFLEPDGDHPYLIYLNPNSRFASGIQHYHKGKLDDL